MNKISFILIIAVTFVSARINPFFISQSLTNLSITSNHLQAYPALHNASISLPSSARILKQVTVKFINVNGSVGTKTINFSNKIDWRVPIYISQSLTRSSKSASVKLNIKPVDIIKFHKFLTLNIFSQSATFLTKDKKLRYFMMVSPYRAVLDFKRKNNFLSFNKQIKNSIFKTVAIGNHNGFYRVVLELDGDYRCLVSTTKQGYKLSCF